MQNQVSITSCNTVVKRDTNSELHVLIERFWVQEELSVFRNNWTQEEIDCDEHFGNIYRHDPEDGRFVIELPFKRKEITLGDSLYITYHIRACSNAIYKVPKFGLYTTGRRN